MAEHCEEDAWEAASRRVLVLIQQYSRNARHYEVLYQKICTPSKYRTTPTGYKSLEVGIHVLV